MKLASEVLYGTREELIAYLSSWGLTCHDTESDIELRLAAQKNFQLEGPGVGPIRALQDARQVLHVAGQT